MLKEKLNQDLKQAMINKDGELSSLLRMLLSAVKNEEILKKQQQQGLKEEEMIAVLKREVKKRKDSVEQYIKGGRQDLADKEKKEIEVIAKYLPEEMSEEDIKKVVAEVISSMGEVSSSQFGAVMGQVMAKLKSQADGAVVSRLVREALNK